MNRKETIEQKLREAFSPLHLEVADESHMHSVPEGAQSHFKVTVVSERFDGDGETFDFGIDHTECGNVKYLNAQDADELTPYICDLEYVTIKAMGFGVQRTKTLAWGCDRCDFRFSKNGVTSAPWPPEFAERTCGEPQT